MSYNRHPYWESPRQSQKVDPRQSWTRLCEYLDRPRLKVDESRILRQV